MREPKRSVSIQHKEQNRLITFYQRVISPIDGDRCPMEPSCSAYGAQAISGHGLIRGGLMTADRLIRCGFDLSRYPKVWQGRQQRFLDPVPQRFLRD